VAVVVDTNVAMVASRLNPQADERCVSACIKQLKEIMDAGGLFIDDSGLILREYTKNLGFRGQPGPGHAFAKWAYSHQAIPEKITRVDITQRLDLDWRRFDQFPDQPNLSTFDKSDQKFVAVAVASGQNPPILHATDKGWWNHKDALATAGVSVESLCPHHAPEPRKPLKTKPTKQERPAR
jgi:hypothetical protein